MDERRSWPLILWVSALCAIAFALMGCGRDASAPPLEGAPAVGPSDALTFQTVAPGESLAENSEVYKLVVLDEDAERAKWVAVLNDPEAAQALAAVDLATHLIVGAISSQLPSSGYGISIAAIRLTENGAMVRVTVGEPEPGQNMAEMIGQPYHFVIFLRSELALVEGTRWIMRDEAGSDLAETTYP